VQESLSRICPCNVSSPPSLITCCRYRGRVIATGLVVAMKKLTGKNDVHGADPSALRELRVLKEIAHANVVGLVDAFFHKT
jgi:hypothetical protein